MNSADEEDHRLDSSTCCCQYMTLVPRGLHFAAREWTQGRISLQQSVWAGEPEQTPYTHRDHESNQSLFKSHSVAVPIGTLHSQLQGKPNISIGYNKRHFSDTIDGDNTSFIWTKAGQHSYIWWQFTALSTPPDEVANLRAMGPITALVGSWELPIAAKEQKSTLSEMTGAIQARLQSESYQKQQFISALRIWRQVALSNWKGVSERVRDNSLFDDNVFAEASTEKRAGLKFRISCLRPDDPSYTYSRRDLIMAIANDLVPATWTVDLKHYDIEVVLFLREESAQNQCAIGFSLHPYQYIGCHSFSSGILPPDVAPPYITHEGIVRLRPSTAQLLLHLAYLSPGAIVLDPCVGIGTIAHECAYSKYIGLGGDIVLAPTLLAPQATSYATAIQKEQQQVAATLVAWDAANVPIRTGAVDAVVSDLPFGRLCLSSSKLQQLLPLVMNEMARVLRPCSGTMVLLCGHYKLVVDALEGSMISMQRIMVFGSFRAPRSFP